jgi:4-hydroxybenzoate polyprenyltransferase
LIRLPNLFSVPGDPLAGFFIAAAGASVSPVHLAAGCGAMLFLYMAGLILNDLMDFDQDLAERPERPLPSGTISRRAAQFAFLFCTLAAFALCSLPGRKAPLLMCLLVFLCVCLYNIALKGVRVIGPVSMGLCRGCSMLLGAAMFSGKLDDPIAIIIAVHTAVIAIALITMIADFETRKDIPVIAIWLPGIIVLGGLVAYRLSLPLNWRNTDYLFCLAGGTAVYLHGRTAMNIWRRRQVTPPDIGRMIGAHMFIQSAWLFAVNAYIAGGVVLLLWPINRLVVRKIYAS